MLDSQYFGQLHSENVGQTKFTAYKPKYGAMCLFSEDGTPLACFQLKVKNNVSEQAIFAELPTNSSTEQRFQGVFTSGELWFEFVVTNCTDDELCFNILRHDYTVKETDPGPEHGINLVNELHKFQSYAVPCDQQNKKTFICETVSTESKPVTLETEEGKTSTEKLGKYYYLSVLPKANNTEVCSLFENTYWKCSDIILVKSKIEQPYLHTYGEYPHYVQHGGMLEHAQYQSQTVPMPYIPHAQYQSQTVPMLAQYQSQTMPLSHHIDSFQNESLSLGAPTTSAIQSEQNAAYTLSSNTLRRHKGSSQIQLAGLSAKSDEVVQRGGMKCTDSCKRSSDKEKKNVTFEYDEEDEIDDESEEQGCDGDFFDDAYDAHGITSATHINKQDTLQQKEIKEVDIFQSHVATVKHGHMVSEHSRYTGLTYRYDRCSKKCKIGLSVIEGVEFLEQDRTALIEEAKELIKSYQQQKYKVFFEKNKIYESETCCICMTNKPDIIFYQCGHQCIDSECGQQLTDTKCPFCRSSILAKLDIKYKIRKEHDGDQTLQSIQTVATV